MYGVVCVVAIDGHSHFIVARTIFANQKIEKKFCEIDSSEKLKENRNNTNLPYQYFRIEILKRLLKVNVCNLQY